MSQKKYIRRAEHSKENPYVMVRRNTLQDTSLSYEALGMLGYILSQPDNWRVEPSELVREGCGRDKVYRILKELIEKRYIEHEKHQGANNLIRWGDYVVHERPYTENPYTENQDMDSPSNRFPENPYTEKPDSKDSKNNTNTITKENTRARARKSRSHKKSNIEVQFRSDWDANHEKGEALLTAFGTDVKFQKPSELPRAALEPYLEAAKQLKDTSLEDIAALYKFVKNKARDCNWSGFGVMTLPKYYPEFLTHRRVAEQKPIEKTPPPLPTADPKEFIRRLTGQELVIAK